MKDEEPILDEVGGFHDCGIGYNPQGLFCGECSKTTCKGCSSEFIERRDDNMSSRVTLECPICRFYLEIEQDINWETRLCKRCFTPLRIDRHIEVTFTIKKEEFSKKILADLPF